MAEIERLGAVDPAELFEARLQLHHAAQLVAAVGRSHLEARPDDSHPNLGWHGGHAALLGRAVAEGPEVEAGIRLGDATLLVLEADRVVGQLGLTGRSLTDGLLWLEGEMRDRRIPLVDGEFRPPGYALPDHPLTSGAHFDADLAACMEFGRWYASADRALARVQAAAPEASAVRCWPHHFDLATLIVLEGDRSVGVGMTPGDGSYAEPYWYVSPWPYPDTLPALGDVGHWHTEGFTAAVLTARDVVAASAADRQRALVDDFLEEAIAASRRALG